MIDVRNFNEILRKNVRYDNIKSHKKTGLHPPSRKYFFGNITDWGRGRVRIDTSQPF